MFHSRPQAIQKLNELGHNRVPHLFFTDFLGTQAWIEIIDNLNDCPVKFHFPSRKDASGLRAHRLIPKRFPLTFEDYKKKFDAVLHEIKIGNSFLVNLTIQNKIEFPYSLEEIYEHAVAKYKLLFNDSFVVFSPESFIQIRNNSIYSYPMKGTIDASKENAEMEIMNDKKEIAEHVTIVDLIRNDLSRIAKNVKVSRFRYLEKITTPEKALLQVSSEIKGQLTNEWVSHIGSVIFSLLPAGSISGAPKPKTIDIIQKTEGYQRGMYTGVCGYFDGKSLDSFVMIRFIEKTNDGKLYYKSGGGITAFSDVGLEYNEMINKIYVPVH